MALWLILLTCQLLIVTVFGSICTVDKANSCKANCSWSDGSTVSLDISGIVKFPYKFKTSNSDGDQKFRIDLCKGILCTPYDEAKSPVCVSSNGDDGSGGTINLATWTLNDINPYRFTILYESGDAHEAMTSTFSFIQTTSGENEIKYINSDTNNYSFNVTGVCIGQGLNCKESVVVKDIVGPIGIALISLSIMVFLIYFVSGILVMKYYRGAVGKELIPHYNFWIDLPFLIKDGCLFVVSPFRRRSDYKKIFTN